MCVVLCVVLCCVLCYVVLCCVVCVADVLCVCMCQGEHLHVRRDWRPCANAQKPGTKRAAVATQLPPQPPPTCPVEARVAGRQLYDAAPDAVHQWRPQQRLHEISRPDGSPSQTGGRCEQPLNLRMQQVAVALGALHG